MQFQVPQFLDIEDKVIGPLTIKQFLYITGGVGLSYLSYRFIPWIIIALPLIIGFSILGGMLAFYKHNKKPFVFLIESAYNYMRSSRLYIWRRREKDAEVSLVFNATGFTPGNTVLPGTKNGSKLNDLTWSIDVQKTDDIGTDKERAVKV